MGNIGFSYVGLIYLILMLVPNLIWTKHKPQGYETDFESTWLVIIERCGQILCTAIILFFDDTVPRMFDIWSLWLIASVSLMLMYEGFWLHYFTGEKTLSDFYAPFMGIPFPGATLPVFAFLFLGIYGRLLWLIIAAMILGIGHIGIHIQHYRQMKNANSMLK